MFTEQPATRCGFTLFNATEALKHRVITEKNNHCVFAPLRLCVISSVLKFPSATLLCPLWFFSIQCHRGTETQSDYREK